MSLITECAISETDKLECEEKLMKITGIDDLDVIKEFMLQLRFLKNNGCLDNDTCKSVEELVTAYNINANFNSDFAELSMLSDCNCLNDYEKTLDKCEDDE